MKLKLFSHSIDEICGSITDGYIARHLTKHEFKSMASDFKSTEFSFSDEKHTIMKSLFGIAFPFKYTYPLTKWLEKFLAKRWGWYLQVIITK